MPEGKVKFFNEVKGFGFIADDESGKDVFVHKSSVTQSLNEGDAVSFEIEETEKGQNAIHVEKI